MKERLLKDRNLVATKSSPNQIFPSSFILFVFVVCDRMSPGCPQTDLVAKASLEPILLAPLPGFWDYRYVPPHSSFEVYPGAVHSPGNSPPWV